MDKFLTIDANTDKTLENVAEIAANFGKFLESSIISKKHDILNLILSNCETDEKKEVNSITKPFDKLFKTPETDKWCR